jgi:hypothetical protein
VVLRLPHQLRAHPSPPACHQLLLLLLLLLLLQLLQCSAAAAPFAWALQRPHLLPLGQAGRGLTVSLLGRS